jgi:hypothetical protein
MSMRRHHTTVSLAVRRPLPGISTALRDLAEVQIDEPSDECELLGYGVASIEQSRGPYLTPTTKTPPPWTPDGETAGTPADT